MSDYQSTDLFHARQALLKEGVRANGLEKELDSLRQRLAASEAEVDMLKRTRVDLKTSNLRYAEENQDLRTTLSSTEQENAKLKRLLEESDVIEASNRNQLSSAQSLAQQAVEERDKLQALLSQAKCPNCDGSGTCVHIRKSTGEPEPYQCEWCHYRTEALSSTPKIEGWTDGERLDWLEANKTTFECTSDSSDFVIFLPESRGSGELAPLFNRTIRAAIDAAVSASLPAENLKSEGGEG